MEQQDLLSATSQQYPQQNLPNATPALVLGIISIVGGFCSGLGLIFGIIGLILANRDKRLYVESPELYSATSYSTSSAGRTCSIVGIVVSSLAIVVLIFYVILIGSLVSSGSFN